MNQSWQCNPNIAQVNEEDDPVHRGLAKMRGFVYIAVSKAGVVQW
ncbi:hypothetical protein [Alcanivorax sediminis]|nr:hypothetical protein [Alcanivorax sediminis]